MISSPEANARAILRIDAACFPTRLLCFPQGRRNSESRVTAHSRFQEWTAAGVFQKLWAMALEDYDELKGIDWSWQSMDGAMTKAPLGGGKNRPKPYR